jgi:5'-methylthioadenosine phosphorylase/5'-methylthioinosine phosphorylase
MGFLAIIGGSGSRHFDDSEASPGRAAQTPYGATSAAIRRLTLAGHEILYLPRHGVGHRIPPHRVNYRANLWALKEAGADRVVGLAAVGGIAAGLGPRSFAIPHQVIDYTYGRDQSFHEGGESGVLHVDFSDPYCGELRALLVAACAATGVSVLDRAVYGVTQGPRLETAAEILRLQRDGCDLVGMTGMPEAVLARELGLCYASLAFVVNWAAGKDQGPIRMDEIERHLRHCMERVAAILAALVQMGSQTRGEA